MIDQLPAMLVTLATLVCCLMIGLGFLYRPSRASAIWSGAFVAAMVASYVSAARSVAADYTRSETQESAEARFFSIASTMAVASVPKVSASSAIRRWRCAG